MHIGNFSFIKNLNNGRSNINSIKFNAYSNLSPLKADTLSFTSMKKSEFSGIDLLVVNTFRAPVEKFDGMKNFQDWCDEEIQKITEKDYTTTRDKQANIQRKELLNEWFDYVLKENDAYTNSISLLILDGITKNLKNDNNALPPILDKGILASTIQNITDLLKENPKAQINFYKLYQTRLMKKYASDIQPTENNGPHSNQTGWIIIPSKENDPQHFEENVKKLKTLSHDSWCTKTYNAEPYLTEGDFHVYLENGKPKLGVRFDKDVIQEIQGEKNDKEIPLKYLSIAQEHVKDSKLSHSTEEEFERAYDKIKAINDFKTELSKQGIDYKTCSTEQLLNATGIKTERNEEGKLILDCYKQPDKFTFEDIGINENRLLKDVVEIKGDANFKNSSVTSLGDLRNIGGNANFSYLKIKSLGNLENIGGNANFVYSEIESLGNLRNIGGNANFSYSKIKSLDNLENIGRDIILSYSDVKSLGKLRNVGGSADFTHSVITSLDNLENIEGDISLAYSDVKSLGKLRNVGGNANFSYSEVTSLGDLENIGGSADFTDSKITSFDNLENIEGDVFVDFHNIQSAGKLRNIGGSAFVDIYLEKCIQNNLCENFVDEFGIKRTVFIGLDRFKEELNKIANGVHLEFHGYC